MCPHRLCRAISVFVKAHSQDWIETGRLRSMAHFETDETARSRKDVLLSFCGPRQICTMSLGAGSVFPAPLGANLRVAEPSTTVHLVLYGSASAESSKASRIL